MASERPDLIGSGIYIRAPGTIIENDVGTRFGESQCATFADAAPGTCDECDFSG